MYNNKNNDNKKNILNVDKDFPHEFYMCSEWVKSNIPHVKKRRERVIIVLLGRQNLSSILKKNVC